MIRRFCVGFALAVMAGCGGATAGGPSDASPAEAAVDSGPADAGPDAPYLACMSASGQLNASLKTCTTDADCVIKEEQTDCCGTTLYVGVSNTQAAAFDTCEAQWVAHFPGCGCASNQTGTEDGKTGRQGDDGGAPQVRCTDFTSNGGVCMTYRP